MNPENMLEDYKYDAFDETADEILTKKSKEIKKIPLEMSKKISSLDNITFLEVVDYNAVDALVKSECLENNFSDNYSQKFASTIYSNVTNQLNQYQKLYNKKIGAFKVTYNKPRHKYGRVFPKKSLGLTSFSKKIRNTFIKDTYVDLDISNAQPAIIHNICKSNNIECPFIEEYIQERDRILQDVIEKYNVTRKDAKQLFISLAFFGSFGGWASSLNLNEPPLKFIVMFAKELKAIAKVVKKQNPDLYETARKLNKDNPLGSFFSLYLQEYETRIMEGVIDWLSNKTNILNFPKTRLKVCTYEFDGLKLLKYNVEKYGLDKLLNDLNNIVLETMGFDIKFEEKPIDDGYEIEYTPTELKQVNNGDVENGVNNDKEAAEKVYELYPHWVYCLGSLYVFDNKTGMWGSDNTLFKTVIMSLSDDLRLIRTDLEGEKYLSDMSYGNTLSMIDKIPPLIKTLCKNDDWLRQGQYSSLGKILFGNGYYDFKEEKFYSIDENGFNPDIVFMGKIHHDLEPSNEEDLEYIQSVKQRLFYDALGQEVGDYFILNLARGLAGDMMKRILFGLGGTDSGKSVVTTAIKLACGDYFGTFNAENLAYRKTSNDEAQLMRWALLLSFKRIIISNEMKSTTVLNGNMIKKVSSGGDAQTGRLHCGNEQEFLTHFLPVCLANDVPLIKPYDDAVDNRLRVISYKKRFVDNPENDDELKKDDNIYDELKTKKFQQAFVKLLILEYLKYQENGLPEEPEDVIKAKDEWIETENSSIDAFLDDFEITNDEKDFIPSKDIQEWLKERKLGISSKKFAMELTKHCKSEGLSNVSSKVKSVNSKKVRGWFGIKGCCE